MHMLMSMTGYGQAQAEGPLGLFTVELRTVNNRFQDISITLPRELNALEMPLRMLIKQEIPRGRIDCRVRFTASSAAQPTVGLNLDLVQAWLEQLRQLEPLGVHEAISVQTVLNLPGVLQSQASTGNETELFEQLRPVVQQALQALNAERRREGEALGRELQQQVDTLRSLAEQIELNKDEVVNRYRERLQTRIAELEADLKTTLDPGRIATEVALFADRVDITEELARLRVHLERFTQLLTREQKEPAGKSIEFLLQEIGREINTTCSKARDTTVVGLGLEMKAVVERLKEQIANIQ
jgi:uncharacterized protein (TIGR00255 family)